MPVKFDESRRALFRGGVSPSRKTIHPPWAVPEFLDRCDRCGACIDRCAQGILIKGDGGFPTVDFARGGCDWCEACVSACDRGALDIDRQSPWRLKAFLNEDCLSLKAVICRACGDACEHRAIYFQIRLGGVAQPVVNQDLCNGCGFCYAVCPQQAITIGANNE